MLNAPAVKTYREAASQASDTAKLVEVDVDMNEDAEIPVFYDLPEAPLEEEVASHVDAPA